MEKNVLCVKSGTNASSTLHRCYLKMVVRLRFAKKNAGTWPI